MSRFKKPLSGLSRLSDRIGGGGGSSPALIATDTRATTGTLNIPATLKGDLVVLFAYTALEASPPDGFSEFYSVSRSFKFTVSFQIRGADTASVVQTYPGSSIWSFVVLRHASGLGVAAGSADTSSTSSGIFPALAGMKPGSRVLCADSHTLNSITSADEELMIIINARVAVSFNPLGSFGAKTYTRNSGVFGYRISLEVLAA